MTVLAPKQEELCERSRWDFSDLAVIFNQLHVETPPEESHTPR